MCVCVCQRGEIFLCFISVELMSLQHALRGHPDINHESCSKQQVWPGTLAYIWSFKGQLNSHMPIPSKDSKLWYFVTFQLYILIQFPLSSRTFWFFFTSYTSSFNFLKNASFPCSWLSYLLFLFCTCMPFSEEGAFSSLMVSETCSVQHQCGCSARKRKQMVCQRLQISVSREHAVGTTSAVQLIEKFPLKVNPLNLAGRRVEEIWCRRVETSHWLTVATGIILSLSIHFLTADTIKVVP